MKLVPIEKFKKDVKKFSNKKLLSRYSLTVHANLPEYKEILEAEIKERESKGVIK